MNVNNSPAANINLMTSTYLLYVEVTELYRHYTLEDAKVNNILINRLQLPANETKMK